MGWKAGDFDEKSAYLWNTGIPLFFLHLYMQPQHESFRGILDLECQFTLFIHSAAHLDSGETAERDGICYERDPQQSCSVEFVEYSGLWSVLCTDGTGIRIWRIMVRGSHLAVDDRSRNPADTAFWKADSGKEPSFFRSDSGRNLSFTGHSFSECGHISYRDRISAYPERSICVSSRKPENDEPLSAGGDDSTISVYTGSVCMY